MHAQPTLPSREGHSSAPIVGVLRKRDRAPHGASEARCREVGCEVLQVFSRRVANWQKQDRSCSAHLTRFPDGISGQRLLPNTGQPFHFGIRKGRDTVVPKPSVAASRQIFSVVWL
jgi:hypothetical protein